MTLTHINERGEARMVDVSEKDVTLREAVATGFIQMNADTLEALRAQRLAKGDALAVARVAGIQAAKRTADLIPLCHMVQLSSVEISFYLWGNGVEITAKARSEGKTGVEMEALTAASVAALTLYDMAKSMDRSMVIDSICLQRKSGGKSGLYWRGVTP